MDDDDDSAISRDWLEIGIFCVIAKLRKSPFIHFTIGLIDVMPILSRLSLIIMKKDSLSIIWWENLFLGEKLIENTEQMVQKKYKTIFQYHQIVSYSLSVLWQL